MTEFNFLKNLEEEAKSPPKTTKLTNNIKYECYDITTHNNKVHTVYIPLRETEEFERQIEGSIVLTETDVRTILRSCNGVTEI